MSVVLQFLPTLRISLCRRPPTSCRWYFNFYLHYGSACAGDHRLHVGGASISTYATDLPAQETTDFMSVVLQFLPTLLPAQETTDFMSVVPTQFLPTLRISCAGDRRRVTSPTMSVVLQFLPTRPNDHFSGKSKPNKYSGCNFF